MLDAEVKNWYRDNYLVSTQPSLIQVDEVNAALNSDLLWWAQGLPRDQLKKALNNSLCLGLYLLPQTTSDLAGKSPLHLAVKISKLSIGYIGQGGPKQIGFLRVLTDDVTFAYLTDVYVLPEYQGKGLGRWILECLNEIIKGWPYLRRFMFITSDSFELYRKTLGAKEWSEITTSDLKVGIVEGPAAFHPQ